jgi:hypothetical protein
LPKLTILIQNYSPDLNKGEKFNKPGENKPIVLVAPLDWGLGHATRCIPIINHLLNFGCEVIIATGGKQKVLLQQEFRNIRYVPLAGYRIRYSNKRWKTIVGIFLQVPKILLAIRREKKWLRGFIRRTKVHAVISDNRYGLTSSRIPSIFITHQLLIKTAAGGLAESTLQRLNYRFIQKFTACWVPDFEGPNNLAGDLSHPPVLPRLPLKYLGALTRFKFKEETGTTNELLIILSGPEPQRSIFEAMLMVDLQSTHSSAVLVRGLPGETRPLENSNEKLVIHNHLPGEMLLEVIQSSRIVIGRPGYSSVMDMMGLEKLFIFVPTPGQPEQEYLGNFLASKNLCLALPQAGFSLARALQTVNQASLLRFTAPANGVGEQVIGDFVESLVRAE